MTRSIRTTLIGALLCGASFGVAVPVLAQEAAPGAAAGTIVEPQPQPTRGAWPQFNLRRFDTNGDGAVSLSELQAARKAEAATIDANGDGKLSESELVNAEIERLRPQIEARVKARIAAQDTDGDGQLSAAELALPPLPERLFKRLDRDGDGTVSAEEMRMRPHHPGPERAGAWGPGAGWGPDGGWGHNGFGPGRPMHGAGWRHEAGGGCAMPEGQMPGHPPMPPAQDATPPAATVK